MPIFRNPVSVAYAELSCEDDVFTRLKRDDAPLSGVYGGRKRRVCVDLRNVWQTVRKMSETKAR